MPKSRIGNDDSPYSEIPNAIPQWFQLWGVRRRFVAKRSMEETALSMGVEACQKALRAGGESVGNIDLILANTSAVYGHAIDHRRYLPHWCTDLKSALGAKHALAWNIEMECLTFLVSLQIAVNFVRQGRFRRILVCSAEHVTQHLDYSDRSSTIFADGAAAALITDDDNGGGLLSSAFATNSDLYTLATFRWLYPRNMPVNRRKSEDFRVYFSFHNPIAMQSFVPTTVPAVVKSALQKANLGVDDIQYFVFHQPAERLIKIWADAIGNLEGRYTVIVPSHGSQVSVAMPTTLIRVLQKGGIKAGDKIVIAGAATGWSYGAQVWQWGETKFIAESPPPTEG